MDSPDLCSTSPGGGPPTEQPDILLLGLCARFQHPSLGLRCLLANLGALRPRARLLECSIDQRPMELLEQVLRFNPKILALSVAIWNVELAGKLATLVKKVRPQVRIILGGPEVSHEPEDQAICKMADYVICGEGELAFASLAADLLSGRPASRHDRIIKASLPPLSSLALPYKEYTDSDLKQRFVYVEASRGCPFTCAFCLSALDTTVREFPQERLFHELSGLINRGARHFKFVDRTFNLQKKRSEAVVDFFLNRPESDLFLHAEIVPELLSEGLRERLAQFPQGRVQLEIGIQSFHAESLASINRSQDSRLACEALSWLRRNTLAHLHVDLIAGLPGETLESFASGFDRLYALQPHEIQVGILKRLRGAPLGKIAAARGFCFSPYPPYEVLVSDTMSFSQLAHLRHFAKIVDLVANSGRFSHTTALLLEGRSPFSRFSALTIALLEQLGRVHSIALPRLREAVAMAMIERLGYSNAEVHLCKTQDEQDEQQRHTRKAIPQAARQQRHTPQS